MHSASDGEKPQMCIDVFDKPPSIYVDPNKLDKYTVEELITLNECGKAYAPQINLNLQIINHPTYSIPALLEQLKKKKTDEQRYYIIDTITDTPEFKLNSYQYEEQFRKDKALIVNAISDAVSKMDDGEYKKSSARKLFLIKKYFDENS